MSAAASYRTPAEKIVETVLAYYQQAEPYATTVTMEEMLAWYDTLCPASRRRLLRIKAAQWVDLPAFKRYLLEKRGFSMQSFMRASLTPQELTHWVNDSDGGV